MRVLDKTEVTEVSGGTFCLLGGLFSSLFSCLKPKAPVCAPAPKCDPAPVCAPKHRRGC